MKKFSLDKRKQTFFAMWGVVITVLGLFTYLLGVFLASMNKVLIHSDYIFSLTHNIVWYSGIPIIFGFTLIAYDLFFIVKNKRDNKNLRKDKIKNKSILVVLTAYNDELSIAKSVKDFQSHKNVKEVIVVSNNSSDNTMKFAEEAGATVYNEISQGYGSCVYRCYIEALKRKNQYDLLVLCEGDMTFRSYDIDKLLAYIPHADVVNGTRIVESLQEKNTQLSMFMHYGNFFVAKLLELKYLGNITLSDVGTTYKIIRMSTLENILPKLDKRINLTFNPYFLEKVIKYNYDVVECPITFYPRVGISKGGNINNLIAFKLGMQMIIGILFTWENLYSEKK
jgi:glycosyltransferase involved in cell wall biosynthesis